MSFWHYFYFQLPLIHSYSLFTQLSILSILLVLSITHRISRFIIAGLILSYFLFNALSYVVPPIYHILAYVVGWGWTIFKGIAIFGFYVHFFKIGVSEGWGMIVGTVQGMIQGLKEAREEREHKESEERRKQRYEDAGDAGS